MEPIAKSDEYGPQVTKNVTEPLTHLEARVPAVDCNPNLMQKWHCILLFEKLARIVHDRWQGRKFSRAAEPKLHF